VTHTQRLRECLQAATAQRGPKCQAHPDGACEAALVVAPPAAGGLAAAAELAAGIDIALLYEPEPLGQQAARLGLLLNGTPYLEPSAAALLAEHMQVRLCIETRRWRWKTASPALSEGPGDAGPQLITQLLAMIRTKVCVCHDNLSPLLAAAPLCLIPLTGLPGRRICRATDDFAVRRCAPAAAASHERCRAQQAVVRLPWACPGVRCVNCRAAAGEVCCSCTGAAGRTMHSV
jgi:hypothetical protein